MDEIPDPGGAMALRADGLAMHTSLPDSLSRQFESLKRRIWRFDTLVAATGGIGSLLLSWLFLFASDRLWDTPHWLRLILAFAGWAGFATFLIGYGNRWIWAKPSVRSLAVIVQGRYRRLGDRLLGIVELADPQARPSNYSAELCRAAIAQVAGEASSFDFREAAVRQRPMRQLYLFAALALLAISIATVVPDAARNAFLRWLTPSAGIARYTFTAIEPLPTRMVIPQGEPFAISLKLQPHSWWQPASATARFPGIPPVTVPVRNGVAEFKFPGQTQARVLRLSTGDATQSIRIQPSVRPDLETLDAEIHLPAYLQYPSQKIRIETGSISFLPGTTVNFSGAATQPLASARVEGAKPLKMEVRGSQFSGGPLLLELARDIQFTWRARSGLAGPAPMTIHAIEAQDEPPHVELGGIEPAVGILADETLHLDLNSADDYGVKLLSLTWQTAAASPADTPGWLHEITIANGKPQSRELNGHFSFSPALLGIETSTTLLVRAQAIDYYPSRTPAVSPIYRIHVLDRQAHAQMIHDQFEKLMEQLEELSRRQSELLQAGKALRAQKAEQLAKEDSTQKLGQQSSDQQQTANDLEKLAKQMAATLSEAMRNPEISPETLKSWASHAEQMNQLSSSAMPAASQSLQSAKSDPANRSQNLDQALAQEQKILDAMRQTEAQGGKDLESLMAKTLAARLRRVADSERAVAADFVQMLPDTVGLTTEQLTADQRAKLQTMSTAHTASSLETSHLESEISRLYDRTSLDRYGDVAKEMIAWKTDDGMAALGKLVDHDIAAQAIETTRYWGDQFLRWASRLEQGDDKSQPNQSQSQPGQPDPSQMQALMALMQLRQRQDQLREQTSTIEEQKQTLKNYKTQAQNAQSQQSALRDAVNMLAKDPKFPVPPEKLAPAGTAMNDAAGLLAQPDTGNPTYAAQTDAINLLDNAIAQQAQKSGQGAQAMAGMMGMGTTRGGTTDKRNQAIPGSREGTAGDQRTVIQAGGVDNSELPGEFRDAIEGYQRAMDQSQ